MTLASAIRDDGARLAAACTACGACAAACPSPPFLGRPVTDPVAAATGLRATLRGEAPTAEGIAWIADCTRSGQCAAACPEALDVPYMMRLAGMRLRGALGEAPAIAGSADTGWAARVKAFGRLTMTEEEQARWL